MIRTKTSAPATVTQSGFDELSDRRAHDVSEDAPAVMSSTAAQDIESVPMRLRSRLRSVRMRASTETPDAHRRTHKEGVAHEAGAGGGKARVKKQGQSTPEAKTASRCRRYCQYRRMSVFPKFPGVNGDAHQKT